MKNIILSTILSSILFASPCDEKIVSGNNTALLQNSQAYLHLNGKVLTGITIGGVNYTYLIPPDSVKYKFKYSGTNAHYVTYHGSKTAEYPSNKFASEVLKAGRSKDLGYYHSNDANVVTGDYRKLRYNKGITSSKKRYLFITERLGNNSVDIIALNGAGNQIGRKIPIMNRRIDQGSLNGNKYQTFNPKVYVKSYFGQTQELYGRIIPLTAFVNSGTKIYGFKIIDNTQCPCEDDGADGKAFVLVDPNSLACEIDANSDDYTNKALKNGESIPVSVLSKVKDTVTIATVKKDATDALISNNIKLTNFDGLPSDTTISSNGIITLGSNVASRTYYPTYKICLEKDNTYCDTAIAAIKVNNVPTAKDDTATTDQGLSIIIDSVGNDTHPENEKLTITKIGSSTHSSSKIVNNKIEYTPNPGFYGIDKFTYTIRDISGDLSTATVTVSVIKGPDVTIGDAQIIEGGDLSFNVSLDHGYGADITFSFSITNDTTVAADYINNPKLLLTIPANKLSGIVNLETIDDLLVEDPKEYLDIKIASSDSDIGSIDDTGRGTIIDNDTPPIGVNDYKLGTNGSSVSIDVLANDIKGTAQIKRSTVNINKLKSLRIGGEGTWSIDNNGIVKFTPEPNYIGDPTVQIYRFEDIGTNGTQASISINYPPKTINDEMLNNVDNKSELMVLDNDIKTSTDIDTKTIKFLTENLKKVDSLYIKDKGVFSSDDSGKVTFTPDKGFYGEVEVDYVVRELPYIELGTPRAIGDISKPAKISLTYPRLVEDIYKSEKISTNPETFNIISNDYNGVKPETVKFVGTSTPGDKLIVNGEGTWTTDGKGNITFTPEDGFWFDPTPIEYTAVFDTLEVTKTTASLIYKKTKPKAEDNLDVPIDDLNGVEIDILANDNFGGYGKSIEEIVSFTKPKHGKIIIKNKKANSSKLGALPKYNKVIVYKPDLVDYVGTDSFEYTITDRFGQKSTATVSVIISCSSSQVEDSLDNNKWLLFLLFPFLLLFKRKK